ncbi:hypothetical protein VTJ83DRAFT_6972 [Remersonia thermophila]|uniref:Uncharacterized protein n=1 Tax=Remersonia thermophila TaxID=72144 RepID=A0ABR4D6G6_9PEZI
MHDDLYRHFGTQNIWEEYTVAKSPVVEVTEFWTANDNLLLPAVIESRNISTHDVDTWLEEPPARTLTTGAYTRSVRLIWVGEDRDRHRSSPSASDLNFLARTWGLEDALAYGRGCFAGVSTLEARGGAERRVFTITYHPKLAVAWSHSTACGTCAIVFAEGEERTELLCIFLSEWRGSTVAHPMYPGLLSSLVLAHGLDKTLAEIKAAVREVEARTGHHRFASRHETRPAAGELGSLSANMSGCAAKLANGTRKMKVVEAINDFIAQHAPRTASPCAQDDPFSSESLALLRHRVAMQEVDTAFVQQRVQIQIAALFHLIAQQDNAIAFSTASATRSIAASSLQDSSSMKMLALVAMFFLPGSFVAALFSAPLFAWEDVYASDGMGVATRPQFALFWAVTAPLTVLVFLVYGMWMCVQGRKERAKSHNAIPLGSV